MGKNYFGLTDKGRQRVNNEDRFIAKTILSDHYVLAAVIDGVGGYVGGEIAAQVTADAITQGLKKLPGNILAHLISILENANDRIIQEKAANPENEKMACVVTLAVVDIEKNLFYFAHVGDTRLYLFRDGSLIKITRDHSTVGFLEESGRITEEAAMAHPKRNEVNKALGYETQAMLSKDFVDTGESPFLPGDLLLLCSDGLTDMIPASKIIAVLNSDVDLAFKGRQLIDAANDAGGNDNITVVLVRNHKSPVQYAVTKPLVSLNKNHNETRNSLAPSPPDLGLNQNSAVRKRAGLFIILITVLLVALVVWFVQKHRQNLPFGPSMGGAVVHQKTEPGFGLPDSLNAPNVRQVRISPGQIIPVTDTIFINKDTLHIVGNGAALISDSSYAGPAFVLSPNCKYILLDSIILQGFSVGVLVAERGLHLKNVAFRNCRVPVVFKLQAPQDTLLSGRQADPVFYFTDSLHK